MKKYLVSLDDDSIEIEVEKLTETDVCNKVENKFGLFGNYSSNLKHIKNMDIYTLTFTKRGSNIVLLIKEIVKESNKSSFDIEDFYSTLDDLLKGNISSISLKNISADDLKGALEKKGFINYNDDTNDDVRIYYFAHTDWEIGNNNEYCDRLNVNFDIRDLSIEISLECGFKKLKEFENNKKEIEKKLLEIESIDMQIAGLEEVKEVLQSDISNLEDEITNEVFY